MNTLFSMSFSKKKLSVVIPLLLLVGLSFSLVNTWAQNRNSSQTLEVIPPSQELSSNPGERVTIKAKVRNKSDKPTNINVRIEDFVASGEEGQVSLVEKGPWSVSSWTTISPNNFFLNPGEEKDVTAIVDVPKTGIAGGRYGSFVFAAINDEKVENAASVTQEVASLFLMKVSGDISETIHITELSAPQFVEFGPVPISIKLQNAGNIHQKPRGLINVTDMFGRTVQDIVFKGENVFPGASRVLTTQLQKNILIGKYKVTAILYYGGKNETITSTTTFFAFPLRFAAIVLVVLGICIMGRKRIKKAFKALSSGR